MNAADFRAISFAWFLRHRGHWPPRGTIDDARLALDLFVGAVQPDPPVDVAALDIGHEVIRAVAGDQKAVATVLRLHEAKVGDRDAQIAAMLYSVRRRRADDRNGRAHARTVARGLTEAFDPRFASLESEEKLDQLAAILGTAVIDRPRRGKTKQQHTFGTVCLEVQRLAGLLPKLTSEQWKARRQKIDRLLRDRFRHKD